MKIIVKCEICHLEYEDKELKCPNCGLNNPIHQAKQCTVCGTTVEPGEKFCSSCGTPQTPKVPTHCEFCEAPLKPSATFCTQCGNKVGSVVATVTPTSVSIDTSYKAPKHQVVNGVQEPKTTTAATPSHGEEIVNPTIMSRPEGMGVPPEITSDVMGRTIRTKDETFVKEESRESSPLMAKVVTDSVIASSETASANNLEFKAPPQEAPPKTPVTDSERGQQYSQANDPELAAELARRANQVGQQTQRPDAHEGAGYQPVMPQSSFEEQKSAYTSSIIDDIDQLDSRAEGSSRLHDELFSIDDNPVVSDYGIMEIQPEPPKKKTSRVLMAVLIAIILIMLGALAFIWFKLLPDGFSIGVGNKESSATSSNIEASAEAPSVPSEPSGEDPAPPASFSYKTSMVAPAIWEEIQPFDSYGIARVAINGFWGIIDRMGNDIIPPTYKIIGEYGEGMAFVMQNDKYGFIDIAGNVAIPLDYDLAHKFSDGFALVVKAEKYLYIDQTGKEFDFGGHPSTSFNEGIAAVNSDSGSYFIDVTGEKVSGDYEAAIQFSDGLAPVKVGGKWGYVNGAYEIVVECLYEAAGAFSNNVAVVTLGGKQLLVNNAGKVVSPEADKIWEMKEGIATAQVGELYGYLDGFYEGFLIEPQYNDALAFSGGVAPAKKGDRWLYIDYENKNVFEDKTFEEAYRFQDGFACVKIGGKYTMITQEGVQAFEDTWENIDTYSNGMIPFQSAGRWGFAEIHGV